MGFQTVAEELAPELPDRRLPLPRVWRAPGEPAGGYQAQSGKDPHHHAPAADGANRTGQGLPEPEPQGVASARYFEHHGVFRALRREVLFQLFTELGDLYPNQVVVARAVILAAENFRTDLLLRYRRVRLIERPMGEVGDQVSQADGLFQCGAG